MFKTRKALVGLLMTSDLLIAACSSQSQAGSEEVMDEEPMIEESTTFVVRIENISDEAGLTVLAPGPAGPGAAYEFTVEAYPGQYLTFATMFVQSNDWIFAPGEEGIALFDMDGNPLGGDITDQIFLWDAGTEENLIGYISS